MKIIFLEPILPEKVMNWKRRQKRKICCRFSIKILFIFGFQSFQGENKHLMLCFINIMMFLCVSCLCTYKIQTVSKCY